MQAAVDTHNSTSLGNAWGLLFFAGLSESHVEQTESQPARRNSVRIMTEDKGPDRHEHFKFRGKV